MLGDRPLSPNTRADYLWRLRDTCCRSSGLAASTRSTPSSASRSRRTRCASHASCALTIAAGADLRDEHNRRRVPLGPASLRKLITCLAAILDDAIEDGHIDRNPARTKRMRVRVPKPQRSFLELDELRALIDAAAAQDPPTGRVKPRAGSGETARRVAELLTRGMSQDAIADRARAHQGDDQLARPSGCRVVGTPYIGRAFIVRVLGYSGVRNSELCDLRIGHVRLHDPGGARFHIPDSKTETGIRVVEMSPDLVEAFVDAPRPPAPRRPADRARRLRRAEHPRRPHQPTARRRDRPRSRDARQRAAREQQGLPPLPRTTPHSLRRTYISIALLANNFDVKWVMSQVGHADSKMTLDVYAQLEQRIKRDHGVRFDALVRSAEEQMHGEELPDPHTDDVEAAEGQGADDEGN